MMVLSNFSRDISVLVIAVFSLFFIQVAAFDNTRYDNVAVYWGQNSYGAANAGDTANYQKTLSYYCQDDAINAIPIAFVNVFFGTGNAPSMNLANTCNPKDNTTFPGTTLPDCSSLASDIKTCQAKGKIVTLSLGGAGGSVGFTDDTQGTSFADEIWNLYLGGTSSTRPFGDAVLDGVDLDIEGGGGTGYAAFISQIRSHASGASKKYYITGAPQCVYPDASLGSVLNAAYFDAIYVQFYNNPCGLQNFDLAQDWNFGLWDNWASTISPNPDVKIYVGAPASATAAGGGYQSISNLSSIAVQMRKSFPSFGGVMLWDASQAYANNRYDLAIKNALAAAGGTGFTYPACSAPAYVSGQGYSGGSQVSYGGYIWQAEFYASSTPVSSPNGEWSAISACSGSGSGSSSASSTTSTTKITSSSSSTSSGSSTSKTSSTSSTSKTTSSTTTSTSSSASPTSSGDCAGVAAWSSGVAYTGGQQVTYGGHLWQANYWTENDTPGGSAGSWTDEGACSSSKRRQFKDVPSVQATSAPEVKRKNSRIFRGI